MRVSRLLVAAALIAVPLSQAVAEPQFLGLLATNAAKPFTCNDTECYVELTSFCMEPGRSSPRHLSRYTPMPGNDAVQFVAETAAGERIAIPATVATFESQRGFAAVRVSIPAEKVVGFKAIRVSAEIGERVTLAPLPAVHHRRPHKPEEAIAAAGPNRDIGTQVVDKGGTPREVADLMSALYNALPEGVEVARDKQLSLWADTFDADALKGFSRSAVREAESQYRYCLGRVESHKVDSLRGCLWRAHDQQVWTLNHRYWNAIPRS